MAFHRTGHQIVLVAILLGGQQLITRLAIQHVIRLTTRRARQRQRAKVCPSLRSSSSGLAPSYAAIFQRHMEVEAGRILGDQALHQRALSIVLSVAISISLDSTTFSPVAWR